MTRYIPEPHRVFHWCDIPAEIKHGPSAVIKTWAMEQARALGLSGDMEAVIYADGSVVVRCK